MVFCVPNGNGLRRALSVYIVLVLSPIFLTYLSTARADTPAQARQGIQAVCDRAAASYGRRNLSGFMAMYSPNCVLRNVVGRKENFRQNQAGIAEIFAGNGYSSTAHCTASQVIPQGNQARAVLRWHYITRHSRSASALAYTVVRDYEEHSVWKKLPGGWLEMAADMTRDTVDYRR